MTVVRVKILGTKSPQRYAVRRAVLAAQECLLAEHPGLQVEITEVKDSQEIQRYTTIFIYPSLVIDEQLVCSGRFPRREEVADWLHRALE
jgi:hypothetical protein